MYYRRAFAIAAVAAPLLVVTAFAVAPTVFVPDWTFKGSSIDRVARARSSRVERAER